MIIPVKCFTCNKTIADKCEPYLELIKNGLNEEESLNTYSFFDASLSYQKKDSKWEYKVGITNILNTKSLNQDNTNTLYTSTSEYVIQPRYTMFSIKYDL